MSKYKVVVQFKNLYSLWQFAQRVRATDIRIDTSDKTLICQCTQEDLELLQQYQGIILKKYAENSY